MRSPKDLPLRSINNKSIIRQLSFDIDVPMEEIKEATYVTQSYKVNDICKYLIKYRGRDANLIERIRNKK